MRWIGALWSSRMLIWGGEDFKIRGTRAHDYQGTAVSWTKVCCGGHARRAPERPSPDEWSIVRECRECNPQTPCPVEADCLDDGEENKDNGLLRPPLTETLGVSCSRDEDPFVPRSTVVKEPRNKAMDGGSVDGRSKIRLVRKDPIPPRLRSSSPLVPTSTSSAPTRYQTMGCIPSLPFPPKPQPTPRPQLLPPRSQIPTGASGADTHRLRHLHGRGQEAPAEMRPGVHGDEAEQLETEMGSGEAPAAALVGDL